MDRLKLEICSLLDFLKNLTTLLNLCRPSTPIGFRLVKPLFLITLLASVVLTCVAWIGISRSNSRLQKLEFVEECVDEYYHHWRQFKGYDDSRRVSEKLLAYGESIDDQSIQARALSRLAFSEIKFAKWGNAWEEKLETANELTQGQNSIARANYLTMSGWIKGNWQSKFEEGLAELNGAIRIAKLHRNDKAFVFASFGAAQVLRYLERPYEATEVAFLALNAAKHLGNHDLLAEAYRIALSQLNSTGLEKYAVDIAKEYKQLSPDDCGAADHILFHAGISDKYLTDCLRAIEDLRDQTDKTPRDWAKLGRQLFRLSAMRRSQGDYAQAIKLLDEVKTCHFESGSPSQAKRVRCDQLMLHLRAGNLEIVKSEFDEISKSDDKDAMQLSPRELADIYENLGRAGNALEWAKKCKDTDKQIQIDMRRNARRQALARWKTELERRAFQDQIALQSKRNSSQKTLLVAILGIVLSCVAVGITRFRTLRQTKKHLESLVRERTVKMQSAVEHAEEAARSKSEFLARANHEIRSPLQAIIGYCELMQENMSFSEEDRKRFVAGIVSSGHHLLSLVNDVIELTKIEEGVVRLSEKNFNLDTVIHEVLEILSESASKKDLELILDLEKCHQFDLHGDETMYRQILINLLSNAIKYTEQGHVKLKLATQQEQSCIQLVVEISDSGPGIPEEMHSLIFEPFADLPQSHLGKGLGLSITKSLTELMNGDIEFESVPDHGTTFVVTLPFGFPRDTANVSHDIEISPEIRRVLVVDDKKIICDIVCRQLAQLQLETRVCADPLQAKMIATDWKPDLVLLDLRMPSQCGFDVLAEIKTLFPNQLIIAMTGDSTDEIRQKTIESGFDGFLAKPFQISRLRDAINKATRARFV